MVTTRVLPALLRIVRVNGRFDRIDLTCGVVRSLNMMQWLTLHTYVRLTTTVQHQTTDGRIIFISRLQNEALQYSHEYQPARCCCRLRACRPTLYVVLLRGSIIIDYIYHICCVCSCCRRHFSWDMCPLQSPKRLSLTLHYTMLHYTTHLGQMIGVLSGQMYFLSV